MARVYGELWLSLASIPHDSSEEEAPMCPQRGGSLPTKRDEGGGEGRGRGGSGGRTAKEEENRNLLGSECNFIVNLSLSEGKQWSDLRTVRPRSSAPVHPRHHLT